jgi:hypothetical protein
MPTMALAVHGSAAPRPCPRPKLRSR